MTANPRYKATSSFQCLPLFQPAAFNNTLSLIVGLLLPLQSETCSRLSNQKDAKLQLTI